jgi:hypothetical protein
LREVFNIFPDRLYACMMQKVPPGDQAYERLKKGVDRFMVALYDHKLEAGSKANKKWKSMDGKGGFDAGFWRNFGNVYASSPGIRDAWLDKFAPTLDLRTKDMEAMRSRIHTKMVWSARFIACGASPIEKMHTRVIFHVATCYGCIALPSGYIP